MTRHYMINNELKVFEIAILFSNKVNNLKHADGILFNLFV